MCAVSTNSPFRLGTRRQCSSSPSASGGGSPITSSDVLSDEAARRAAARSQPRTRAGLHGEGRDAGVAPILWVRQRAAHGPAHGAATSTSGRRTRCCCFCFRATADPFGWRRCRRRRAGGAHPPLARLPPSPLPASVPARLPRLHVVLCARGSGGRVDPPRHGSATRCCAPCSSALGLPDRADCGDRAQVLDQHTVDGESALA